MITDLQISSTKSFLLYDLNASYFGMGGFVTASIDSKSSDKAAAFNAADIVMNKCILAVECRH